jgi:hypothetical protein
MPDFHGAKKIGDKARALRAKNSGPNEIDCDWTIIRFEPNSGNVVMEKSGKRIVSLPAEFFALNFPGSDGLWTLLESAEDELLAKTKSAWSKPDISAAYSSLIQYARTLDLAFFGTQTLSDLKAKIEEIENKNRSSLELLEIERRRAQKEHDSIGPRTRDNAQKSALFAKWQEAESRIASHHYHRDRLFPLWRQTAAALGSLKNAKNSKT